MQSSRVSCTPLSPAHTVLYTLALFTKISPMGHLETVLQHIYTKDLVEIPQVPLHCPLPQATIDCPSVPSMTIVNYHVSQLGFPRSSRIVDNGTIGPSPLFSIFVALLPAHDTRTVPMSGMRLTRGEGEDANCARRGPQIYGSPISREGHRSVVLNPRAFRVSFVPKASQDNSIRHHPSL